MHPPPHETQAGLSSDIMGVFTRPSAQVCDRSRHRTASRRTPGSPPPHEGEGGFCPHKAPTPRAQEMEDPRQGEGLPPLHPDHSSWPHTPPQREEGGFISPYAKGEGLPPKAAGSRVRGDSERRPGGGGELQGRLPRARVPKRLWVSKAAYPAQGQWGGKGGWGLPK